ncbi:MULTISPECIES: GNAT family acetyltransferase [Pseudomonas syringae group genomosp. 2]|uniref:Putative acetyltransferase n=2 Tax=Pseudomonas syringae group genomosp. 2 TaxID=251698 RepID=A0A0Q0JEM9_PSEA0|nr:MULTISPECIES: GNAT family acetyltransferase [Pseudomonas syringae group genomosp. 2]EGH04921.1 putative acetyltransferase [Pseudomonas amygdali pv. aesculi str. 0893_23]KPW25533.1 putative acetyltransferase [Pseudomonas amygdali pv. aesculi]KPX92795.1 putative acetyltransferase [Pseudomonas meliae]KPZ13054.1 putative acetyltransferase [Pseudomonas amygdali pv. ulmi]KWS30274.1 acetyltransferase [Pseudomonas amygdali pv. ulmi]
MNCIVEYSDPHHRLAVIELWKTVFNDPMPHNRPELSIHKKLAVGDRLFFVAVMDGRVTGTILAGYDGHRGWLYSVAVAPHQRGKGLGTALVRHAEQALTNLGCVKINLQIHTFNESVQAFYQTLGYTPEPIISMGKRIDANVDSH